MKTTLVFIVILAHSLHHDAFATGDTTNARSIHLTIDNDAFLFAQVDQYYSSGLFGRYQTQKDPSTYALNFLQKHPETQLVIYFGLNHQIYTPVRFNNANPATYDRPHAALLVGEYGYRMIQPGSIVSIGLELGWMGPALQTGEILKFWHRTLNYKEPRGWDYQMNNSPVIQLGFAWHKSVYYTRNFDVNFDGNVGVGTVFNAAKTGLGLRFGRLRSVNNSMLYDLAALDPARNPGSGGPLLEYYFLAGMQFEYVLYNATIEGNMFGKPSFHTEKIENGVLHAKLGVGISGARMDFQASYNYRSREVIGADFHHFIQFKLNYNL